MQITHYNRVGLSLLLLLLFNESVHAVEKVAINPASVTLTVGQSQKLTLTGNDFSTANKAVVYKGSKEDTNFTTGLSCKPPTMCDVEIKLGQVIEPGLYIVMLQNEKNQVIATAPLKIKKVNEDPKVVAAKAKAEAEKKAAEDKAKAEALLKQEADAKAKAEQEKEVAKAAAEKKAAEEKAKAEQEALAQQQAKEEIAKQDAEVAKKTEASKQVTAPATDTSKAEIKQVAPLKETKAQITEKDTTTTVKPIEKTDTKSTTPIKEAVKSETDIAAKEKAEAEKQQTLLAKQKADAAKAAKEKQEALLAKQKADAAAKANQPPVVTSIEIPKDIKPGQKFKANITATDDEGVLALAVIYNKQKQPSLKSPDPKKQQNTFTIELTAPKSGEVNIQAMALDSNGVKSAVNGLTVQLVEKVVATSPSETESEQESSSASTISTTGTSTAILMEDSGSNIQQLQQITDQTSSEVQSQQEEQQDQSAISQVITNPTNENMQLAGKAQEQANQEQKQNTPTLALTEEQRQAAQAAALASSNSGTSVSQTSTPAENDTSATDEIQTNTSNISNDVDATVFQPRTITIGPMTITGHSGTDVLPDTQPDPDAVTIYSLTPFEITIGVMKITGHQE